jgi:hypothetical protein
MRRAFFDRIFPGVVFHGIIAVRDFQDEADTRAAPDDKLSQR